VSRHRSPTTLVADASAIVEMLLGIGRHATWATAQLAGAHLAAPCFMPIEVANTLRRFQVTGLIGAEVASLAHADLLELHFEVYPYETVAERAWALRANVATYDACYVALAERLDADLVTLDTRLARAPGSSCRFLTPPD